MELFFLNESTPQIPKCKTAPSRAALFGLACRKSLQLWKHGFEIRILQVKGLRVKFVWSCPWEAPERSQAYQVKGINHLSYVRVLGRSCP